MKRLTGSWILIVVFTLMVLISCGEDDDDDNDQTSDSDDDDNDNDDDQPPDAVTSASPGRASAILEQNHSGRQQVDCMTCHEDAHQNGFTDGQCVTCHGNNGASLRAAGHASKNCNECHANSHADQDFTENNCTACHKYEPTQGCPATEDYDVVVIGAGGGGLSAAAALSLAGLKVIVIEKHYKVGGYMTNFRRGDYRFEVSLHAINGLDDPEDAGELVRLGVFDRLDPVKADPMYRAVFPQTDIYVPSNMEDYKAMLKQMFPDQSDGIDLLFEDMVKSDKALNAVTRIVSDFNLDDLMILLSDPMATLRLLKYMNTNLDEFMDQYITDEKLKGIFLQLTNFLGGGPKDLQALFFMAMWGSYHQRGYYYVKGGSEAISDAMADVILENGGDIKLNTLVTKIVIENGRAVAVETENDACYNARYVVSNANAPDTFYHLVGTEYLPADYVTDLDNMEISVATMQIFMGVDHDFTEAFGSSHEIMVNASYDQNINYDYVYDGDPERAPFIIANYSVVDPSVAPAGKNVISMATYLPYDHKETWRWDQDYATYTQCKEEAAWVYIERAEEFLPGLGDHVEILEVGTPVTNEAFTLNPIGTVYGWSNTNEQATLRRLPQQTPIDNLVLAGAWTFPGGGQATVISSGCGAADMIIEKEAGN